MSRQAGSHEPLLTDHSPAVRMLWYPIARTKHLNTVRKLLNSIYGRMHSPQPDPSGSFSYTRSSYVAVIARELMKHKH